MWPATAGQRESRGREEEHMDKKKRRKRNEGDYLLNLLNMLGKQNK